MKITNLQKTFFILLFLLFYSSKLSAGYFEEGCKYYTFKKYDLAREMFFKHVNVSKSGNSYYFLGEIEKNEGNFEKAEEYYRLSISKRLSKKYKKLAYWNLIIINEQNGKLNEMALLCKELWEKLGVNGAKKKVESLINKYLWTNNAQAKELYNIGMAFKKKKMIDEARNAFYDALQLDSTFLAPKFEIGLIFYNEDNINYAIHYLKDVIDEITFYGEVHLLLGEIYFNKQLYHYSIDHFTHAIDYGFLDKKTKYQILLKRGTSQYKIKEYENAHNDITSALKIYNNSIEPLLLLSAIYIKNNNFDQALKMLAKAKKIKPANREILFQIGSIYYKIGDHRYLKYFDSLLNKIEINKTQEPQKYFKAFILLFKNYYKEKNYDKASKIITNLPEYLKSYEINLMSAKTYHNIGNYGKAIEYFEKISLENDDKYFLSISYAKNGMQDKSINILRNLSNFKGYLEKAKTNSAIRELAYNIENEKHLIEEERRQAEEERKKIDEERIRQVEEERRALEEEKIRQAEEEKRNIEEKRLKQVEYEKQNVKINKLNTKQKETESLNQNIEATIEATDETNDETTDKTKKKNIDKSIVNDNNNTHTYPE